MDLETARTNYQNAGNDVANLTSDAPSMLNQLKTNLYGIFSKDNPLVQARDTALSKYLSINDQTRADLLPSNQPIVEGKPLNFSPTQQNAIVSSRNAAALAPLLGLDQLVSGQLGNIGDIVKNAGDIYSSTIAGAKTRADTALDLYKMLYQEQQDKIKNGSSLESDLSSILSLMGMGDNSPLNRPPLDSFDDGYNPVPEFLNGGDSANYIISDTTPSNPQPNFLGGIGDFLDNLFGLPAGSHGRRGNV